MTFGLEDKSEKDKRSQLIESFEQEEEL
jgi:hypothetical protein